MSNKRNAGMTLVELIIAIVIISVGVAGLVAAYAATVKTSADPMVDKQMGAIAEGVMEEIMLKPFAASPNAVPAANARDTFNDVRDYDGYASSRMVDISGSALPDLDGFSLNVAVRAAPVTLVAAQDALKITVTVTHGDATRVLTAWRMCYAGPPC